MNPRLSLPKMIFNSRPCAILTIAYNISQQAWQTRFGQLELAHLYSTPIQYRVGPLIQLLLSCGKAYLLSKMEQGFKLQLVHLFHTHTLGIHPSHFGVFGRTKYLPSPSVHLRLTQPTFMLWYQGELFCSVQFINHISPSCILTYLQKYPGFFPSH